MTEKSKTRTRKLEHVIDVDAPIAAVWKAVSDGEEITRWFAPEATVEPREGGSYWLSFGEGMAGTAIIEVWEPERHLRMLEIRDPGSSLGDASIVVEYFLEELKSGTRLRLVQSGVPEASEWDEYYDNTERGWKMFLVGLRHYLEKHLGQPRVNVSFMHPVGHAVEEAWEKLIGPDGLAARGSLATAEVGKRSQLTTAFGQDLEVEVLVHEPPYTLSMTIDNLQDSLLALDFERMGGRTYLYANLSTFGVPDDQVAKLEQDWRTWLHRIFPGADAQPA